MIAYLLVGGVLTPLPPIKNHELSAILPTSTFDDFQKSGRPLTLKSLLFNWLRASNDKLAGFLDAWEVPKSQRIKSRYARGLCP